MSFIFLVLISIFLIGLGQYLRHAYNNSRLFYLIHGIGLLIILIWAVVATSNQTGGVNWPWWILGIPFSIPLVLSIFIGAFQDIVEKRKEK